MDRTPGRVAAIRENDFACSDSLVRFIDGLRDLPLTHRRVNPGFEQSLDSHGRKAIVGSFLYFEISPWVLALALRST